jgi:hypothetical protein
MEVVKLDFYYSVFKVGGFYFGFNDDHRSFLESQSHSKIGRGRVANVVHIDESGTSYKQYSKNGCFDSDHGTVINDINFRLSKRKKQKTRFVLAIIFLVLSLGAVSSLITSFSEKEDFEGLVIQSGIFAVATFFGVFLLLLSTKIRKPYLIYDIAPKKEKMLQAFFDEISKIEESEKIWIVRTVDRHGDTRRNAGSTASVSRKEVNFSQSSIDGIETNVYVPNIGNRLYFLPDTILYFVNKTTKSIPYSEIEIQLVESQFRENGDIPTDGEKIGSSWKFVNNDGSPDRRFNGNRKIPIMKYCEIKLKSKDGFLFRIQTSNYETGKTVANTLYNYGLKK